MRVDYPRAAKTGWRRFVPSWRQLLALGALGFLALVAAFVALYAVVDVPQPNDLALAQSTTVYYADGKRELGTFAEVDRRAVSLAEIPQSLQDAVVATEDRSFYDNRGISPTGIVRAFWNNLTGGATQGGSTITQQYARNAFLSQDQTYTRKVKEVIVSLKLDRELSKQQILEDYLNTIYFGRGAYGAQVASENYFGKPVQDLTVGESAALAALIRGPSLYDPAEGKAQKAALKSRIFDYVLPGMVSEGFLTQAEADSVRMPKFVPPSSRQTYAGPRGYLLSYVSDELQRLGFSKDEIQTGGLSVVTTFDAQAQRAAVQAMQQNFPTVDTQGVQAGLASVEPGSGAIRAMYGGKNYLRRFINNAAVGQPVGSTFKAFTLAAALDNGYTYSDTFYGNSPYTIPGTSVQVSNQGGASYGSSIPLIYALENSVNTAFVNLTVDMGPQKAVNAAVAAGIPRDTPALTAVPAVTIGPMSASPIDMAGAYATFAAEGQQYDPFSVQEVRSPSGEVLYRAKGKGVDAFSPAIANEVTYGLTQVVQNGTGYNAQALGRPAAGKTGNHEGLTAWFVGYTPQLSTAVMFYRDLKNDPQAPLNGVGGMPVFTGAEYPTRIWTAYTDGALAGQPVESFPPAPSTVVTPVPSPTSSSAAPTPSSSSPTPSPTPTSPSPTSPAPSPSPTGSPPSPSATGGQAPRQGQRKGSVVLPRVAPDGAGPSRRVPVGVR